MNLITENQLPLILTSFALGTIVAVFLIRRHVSERAWKIADLLWICLGGIGALTAVVAGIYVEDSSRLDRQIDLAFAATREFDRDAARFRLGHCEMDHPGTTFRGSIRDLCDKVEFLSASTAGNSELPLFLAVSRKTAPLHGLFLGFGAAAQADAMMTEAGQFDEAEFLAFAAEDDVTRAAVALLRQAPSVAGIAAEYQVIARSYEDLIEEVGRLRDEWTYLQDHSAILTLQVIALCFVAFAAPLRLGKSVVDLR